MNAKTDKVLILSGDFGDGHKQAARAIADTAQESISALETTVVDFVKWTHPHLHVVGNYCYTQWTKKLPSVYGFLFTKTRADNSPYSFLFKKIKMFTMNRMIKLLDEINPSVVVSTFPPAAAAMSILKANGLVTIPTVTVITDHTDHSYWIHPYTDHYLVGSEHVRQALLRQGVSNHQITVTGIPIRPQFSLNYDPEQLRDKHGIKQTLTTVLIMGGGLGMISKTFIRMLQKENCLEPIQFVIICGHNEKLKEKLT